MVRMMGLAVVVLGLVAGVGVSQDKKDERTVWVFEGGWYSKEKDGSWMEMSEATFRKGGKPAKFGEAKRTKDFIDLYDDSRRLYVRLWDKHAEILNKKGDWEKTQTGRWQVAEKK